MVRSSRKTKISPRLHASGSHIWAASNGHTEIAKALLKVAGIEVNVKTKDGKTALTLAASNGYTDIAKALQAAGGL